MELLRLVVLMLFWLLFGLLLSNLATSDESREMWCVICPIASNIKRSCQPLGLVSRITLPTGSCSKYVVWFSASRRDVKRPSRSKAECDIVPSG